MRRALLLLVAVFVIGACSDDGGGGDGGGGTNSTIGDPTTDSTTDETTASVATIPDDPAACVRGTFAFVSQEYAGPVNSSYGPITIDGGEGGRQIELRTDGTFTFTDDGSEAIGFTIENPNGPVAGTAELIATADGVYEATADTINIDVTALSGTLNATLETGQQLPVALPPDGAGVEETFGITGGATFTCDGDRVTAVFPTVTVVLERM